MAQLCYDGDDQGAPLSAKHARRIHQPDASISMQELRGLSGAPITDCKKALEESQGDMEKVRRRPHLRACRGSASLRNADPGARMVAN